MVIALIGCLIAVVMYSVSPTAALCGALAGACIGISGVSKDGGGALLLGGIAGLFGVLINPIVTLVTVFAIGLATTAAVPAKKK
jgi:hypothetical protein